jgi:uncharacterized LabA/DUF88 family protein
MAERFTFYIDGHNLYNGLKESGQYHYIWLDLSILCKKLIGQYGMITNQEFDPACPCNIKFFTALPERDERRSKRHQKYLLALEYRCSNVKVIKGSFQYHYDSSRSCANCGNYYEFFEEKQTDVSIASHMVEDYYCDDFDVAILISGDSDFVPPLKIIRDGSLGKQVFVFFPPLRGSDFIMRELKKSREIPKGFYPLSQFPDPVIADDGKEVSKPERWKNCDNYGIYTPPAPK